MKTSFKARVRFDSYILQLHSRLLKGLYGTFAALTSYRFTASSYSATLLYVLKTIGWAPTLHLGIITYTNQWLYFQSRPITNICEITPWGRIH